MSPDNRANNGRSWSWYEPLITFLGTALGIIFVQLSSSPPRSPGSWFVLIVGACVGGLAAAGLLLPVLKPPIKWFVDLVRWFLNGLPGRSSGTPQYRFVRLLRRIPLRTVIPVCLALILAIAFSGPALNRLEIAIRGCDPPVELTALSSPIGLDPARKLVTRYERWTAESNYGCPTANVYVYAVSEDTARQTLSDNWDPDPFDGTEPLRDAGPRPDVWLPDSSLEVNRLDSTVKNTQITANEYIGSSPLVVAITATALLPEMQRRDMSWSDLFDQATASDRGIVRPDPSTSLVGVISTAVLYGNDIDGTGAWMPEQPVLDRRTIEQRIGQSLDRGRYPLGDEADLLCRHRELDDPRAAVVVSEQQLRRFNQGQPLGGECGSAEFLSPADKLVPLYLAKAPSLDHRIVRFRWSESKPAEKAAEFSSWLSSEAGRDALADVSLRPSGFAGEHATGGDGVSEDGPAYIASDTAAMDTTRAEHNIAQRRGRVLVAVDVSGSMGASAKLDTGSRFDVVSQSVQAALPSMGDRDEIGLSLFPGEATGLTVRQAVPIGSRDDPLGPVTRGQVIIDELGRSTPDGDTPLFRAIVDGVAAVGPSDDSRINGLIVLTDGEDTTSGLAPDQVLAAVQGKEVRVFVVSVGEASCTVAPLPDVTRATGGACYDADFESVDERLAEVLAIFFGGA